MRKFLFPFLSLLLLFSCGSGDNNVNDSESTISGKKVSFEKLDSIQIDYLGNPIVHDLDPINSTVLFMEDKEFSEEILVADFEGNIQARFTKSGDVPDSYGSLLAPLRIGRDNSFLAYGSNGFLTYGFNGELQSRVKLKEFRGSNFTRKSMGFGMEKLGNNFLYIDLGSRDIDYTSINLYKELRLLNWLDPESGETEPLIQLPESSIFRNGKYFFRDSWAPVFTVVDDLIYVAFGIEPILYLYETTPPYALVSSFPLDLFEFENYKGTDDYVISLDLFYTSGRTENIKKIDGYIVVAYFPGYSVSDRQESFANKSLEEARSFSKRMREKYTSRIAILDSLGRSLNDFVPEGLVANSMLVRNGELWMQEKPDEEVEQDYFRLFRVGLKVDGIRLNHD